MRRFVNVCGCVVYETWQDRPSENTAKESVCTMCHVRVGACVCTMCHVRVGACAGPGPGACGINVLNDKFKITPHCLVNEQFITGIKG